MLLWKTGPRKQATCRMGAIQRELVCCVDQSHKRWPGVYFLEGVVLEGWMDLHMGLRAVQGSQSAPQPQGSSVAFSPLVGEQKGRWRRGCHPDAGRGGWPGAGVLTLQRAVFQLSSATS